MAQPQGMSLDRATLATSFRRIAHAAEVIRDVLHENENLNNSVPANWPLGMSADEFVAECFAVAEHYEAPEAPPDEGR